MALEPLNLALARADAAQQVANIVAQADRAGRAAAGRETQASAAHDATSVGSLDASQGSRIREEAEGGTAPYEGQAQKREEAPEKEAPPEDPEGKGRKLDITA